MPSRVSCCSCLIVAIVTLLTFPQPLLAESESRSTSSCESSAVVLRSYREGRWFLAETANLQARCEHSMTQADNLARQAEILRQTLHHKWFGDSPLEAWKPRCQIVLHSNQQSYLAAVGRGAVRTVGSSLVRKEKGRILSRRIDLLPDDGDFLTAALPHEMTHVIFKDQFTTTKLPHWADEGIAILADTESKQDRHSNDLQNAIVGGTAFHIGTLVAMEDYPSADRFGAFYGQSASLTEFLVNRKTPVHFVQFLEHAGSRGYDAALEKCYGISGLADLNRQWREHVSGASHP